jgi:hypothetical protein
MIDRAFAETFAHEWIDSWNAHDLERIFAHYVEDFDFSSPLIAERGFSATGHLKGKKAMRPYWSARLSSQPPLRFEMIEVFSGVDSISIHYRNVGRNVLACETFILDAAGRVVRSVATYGRTV